MSNSNRDKFPLTFDGNFEKENFDWRREDEFSVAIPESRRLETVDGVDVTQFLNLWGHPKVNLRTELTSVACSKKYDFVSSSLILI
jgi:hypothetical protein